MPRPLDQRGHLVPEADYDRLKEAERQARVARFEQRSGSTSSLSQRPRDVMLLDSERVEDWEAPSARSHDPHTLEAMRARLVGALNSRSE